MHYVYILKLNNKNLYTGFTNNLKRRITEHQAGKTNFVSKHLPCKLIYYEVYSEKQDALNREKYLKTTTGKKMLKKQINHAITIGEMTEWPIVLPC